MCMVFGVLSDEYMYQYMYTQKLWILMSTGFQTPNKISFQYSITNANISHCFINSDAFVTIIWYQNEATSILSKSSRILKLNIKDSLGTPHTKSLFNTKEKGKQQVTCIKIYLKPIAADLCHSVFSFFVAK